jgi:glycosyltransferase involved in cell wall biosynthesis
VLVPKLSIVVVVHRMAAQARRTLRCLTPAWQRNVDARDYEVIVVENDSDDLLGEVAVRACGENFRYLHRVDERPTPAFALAAGIDAARSDFIGVLLDGAHLLTPRIIEFALVGRCLSSTPVIAVPGYHLGPSHQHRAHREGYDEAAERRLLAEVPWESDPYLLFGRSVRAPGNTNGFLLPLGEAGMLFTVRYALDDISDIYLRFVEEGGGPLASFLFKGACGTSGAELFVLAGEGAFHQFHGGVFTSDRPDRAALMEAHMRRALLAEGTRARRARLVGRAHPRSTNLEAQLLGTLVARGSLHALRSSTKALALRIALDATRQPL